MIRFLKRRKARERTRNVDIKIDTKETMIQRLDYTKGEEYQFESI